LAAKLRAGVHQFFVGAARRQLSRASQQCVGFVAVTPRRAHTSQPVKHPSLAALISSRLPSAQ
jgi:hypothetical protein